MEIAEAQQDLRRAYVGAGPGVFISGLVWLVAAFVERRAGTGTAFAALFFGGMLIYPLGTAVSRLLFRRKKEASANPLGRTALESTFAMIAGLIAAWLFLPYRPEWVFPLSAIMVGTHYAVFRTVYGDRTFWLLGGLITAVGAMDLFMEVAAPGGLAVTVGIIEISIALVLARRAVA